MKWIAAGVGVCILWQKYLPGGGGTLWKCDLCRSKEPEKPKTVTVQLRCC